MSPLGPNCIWLGITDVEILKVVASITAIPELS